MTQKLEFPDNIRPDFQGFSPDALKLLSMLKKNNNRAWFKNRKEAFEKEVKFSMECLLGEFTPERRPRDFALRGDPKRGIFRIYRDIRFSKDKTPYKTHCGGVLTRSGAKSDPGVIYIHIEPGNSFLSAGFYSLEKTLLNAWRERIARNPDEFIDIITQFSKPRGKYFIRRRDTLKTMPRGFQEHADSPVAHYIKWKHFLVGRKVTDKQVQSRKLIELIYGLEEVAQPLLSYGWGIQETAYKDDPRTHMRSKT